MAYNVIHQRALYPREATVGLVTGAAGTDVALETANVVLMADDLEKLAHA